MNDFFEFMARGAKTALLRREGPSHGLIVSSGWFQPEISTEVSPFGLAILHRFVRQGIRSDVRKKIFRAACSYVEKHGGRLVPYEPGKELVTSITFPELCMNLGLMPESFTWVLHGFWNGTYLPYKQKVQDPVHWMLGQQILHHMHTVR